MQATLELQSYLSPARPAPPQYIIATVEGERGHGDEETDVVAATAATKGRKSDAFGQLLERLERMEADIKSLKKTSEPRERDKLHHKAPVAQGPIICHKRGKEGHYARGCATKRFAQSGNEQPSQP